MNSENGFNSPQELEKLIGGDEQFLHEAFGLSFEEFEGEIKTGIDKLNEIKHKSISNNSTDKNHTSEDS
jgi:hypothetical protein